MSEHAGAEVGREPARPSRTDELIGLLQKPFVAEELLSALKAIWLSGESIRAAAG